MLVRKYFDPHYKPDRTAVKYRADRRFDEKSAKENAAFVAAFLQDWAREPTGSSDPAATLKALRTEARRLKKLPHPTKKRRPKEPPSLKKQAYAAGAKRVKFPPHPWLHRKSSLNLLRLSDAELLEEYRKSVQKIKLWREERSEASDLTRKRVLADQVQVQLEKRNDIAAILYDRMVELDV